MSKKIKGFKDLAKPNTKVLVTHGAGQVGMWEDIAGRTGNIQLTKHSGKIFPYLPQIQVLLKKLGRKTAAMMHG